MVLGARPRNNLADKLFRFEVDASGDSISENVIGDIRIQQEDLLRDL